MNVKNILNNLEAKHPGEQEYLQAVHEVLESIEGIYNENPQYEAAKIIENTQRDLNIALVNELAIIFNKMGIDCCCMGVGFLYPCSSKVRRIAGISPNSLKVIYCIKKCKDSPNIWI